MIALVAALAVTALPDLHVHPDAVFDTVTDHAAREIVTKRDTEIALIATAVVLLALEAAIVHQRDKNNDTPTISQVMAEWGNHYGTIPWTVGVMAGHWFWNTDSASSPKVQRANAMVLVWTSLGILMWDAIDHSGNDHSRAPVLLVGGFVAGHVFWGQERR